MPDHISTTSKAIDITESIGFSVHLHLPIDGRFIVARDHTVNDQFISCIIFHHIELFSELLFTNNYLVTIDNPPYVIRCVPYDKAGISCGEGFV